MVCVFDGLSIMTYFFAEFVHTDNGFTCSASGFVELSTAQECSGAVSYAKLFNSKARYQSEQGWSSEPKGCSILDEGSMYFNTHTTGGNNSHISRTSICKKGNT